MAISNQEGSLLLNTSNKSELAMGYATLYGDLCGALSPLGDVLKTSVYDLARFCNREKEMIPSAILSRPPTAELRENQLDADTLPPYEALDPILERLVEKVMEPKQVAEELGAPIQLVEEIQHKIHLAEYKRRQAPPSIRVTSKCFSKGRVVPIVSTLIS
jgi:NAD+ synthase (glutamine-hydrolysing)